MDMTPAFLPTTNESPWSGLIRPEVPRHWRPTGDFLGLAEFDAALSELHFMADGHSLPCRIKAEQVGDEIVYTVVLAKQYESRCRSIARRFEIQFRRNTGSRLGASFNEWDAYCSDLLDLWRDAQTYRSEFLHWLHREQLPYVGDPSHRTVNQEVVPCLRIRVSDADAIARIRSEDKGQWASRPY
jgi:hypothetical protein